MIVWMFSAVAVAAEKQMNTNIGAMRVILLPYTSENGPQKIGPTTKPAVSATLSLGHWTMEVGYWELDIGRSGVRHWEEDE
jgi:uncharacterized membrane protein